MEKQNTVSFTGPGNDQYLQSMSFLGKLIEYVDDLNAILESVAQHYDADRAYIFEFSADRATIDNTYEYCKPGVEPQIDILQNVPYESVSAWVAEFERVGAFFISSLDKELDSNSLTYEILEPQGIESLITAPIYKNHEIIGFVGVDNPHENASDVVILKTTASIIYSEISRKIAGKNQTIQKITNRQLKQNAELGKIRDIVASANMGIWRIEIIENKAPKMYADETMCRLLGIDSLNRSPEEIYNDWFSNITPDAVPSVLESVSRMEKGFFDENTYLWKHPTKGIRYVRCGGTSINIPGGYSLQGYHYDVDEVVRKEQAQMLELKNALDAKKEYYRALGSLGDIFYSLHVIDLVNDQVTPLNAKGNLKTMINEGKGANQQLLELITNSIAENYQDRAKSFMDLTTLSNRMRYKKIISQEFVGKSVGWFLTYFIVMECDDDGQPTKAICATRIIDDEKKQEERLIYQTQTDEMTGLLNRRAYEEKIYEHNNIPLYDKFIYVSLDANGLKIINDTIGHAAGDELIVGISQCMKKSLGPYGDLYRIGGDEFVAILYCDGQQILSILDDFDRTIAGWTGMLIEKLTVSYGWVNKYEMPDASTRQLGAVAEQRMYESKSEYYQKQGLDRRGHQDAHKVLCELYTKILKINITTDSYQIINMDETEQSVEKGYTYKISQWLINFGKSGQVHPDDLDEYLRLTDLENIKAHFEERLTALHIFYRRKINDDFKKVMMEIIPANDYSKDNVSLFLYVKDID